MLVTVEPASTAKSAAEPSGTVWTAALAVDGPSTPSKVVVRNRARKIKIFDRTAMDRFMIFCDSIRIVDSRLTDRRRRHGPLDRLLQSHQESSTRGVPDGGNAADESPESHGSDGGFADRNGTTNFEPVSRVVDSATSSAVTLRETADSEGTRP
ncbi:hypothetical protein [Amycolatopsis sp. cmx-8-4]|uniref:hypothetical protein n=1 Tax=Amycolatopsis sp. cmx-8-4 TaxID=2790947 RepID=UPI00397944F7